ncbi:glycosyltransferase [Caulobacter sp. S45]|uniref:glycosyltransferase n=1 Tax=Caulobacter sp. S45 TaxID=1641861 RepID=UPI00131CC247|nr:glycosyltransferase [Caulobacter sp. S45]
MLLCVMRIPPAINGHGGSQRSWHLLQALCQVDRVHFALIYRESDLGVGEWPLASITPFCERVTKIALPDYASVARRAPMLPNRIESGWLDYLRVGSHGAPRLRERDYKTIAAQLPVRDVSTVFAGRLPSAWVVDALLARGLLHAERKVCDFDDIMSHFRARELESRKLEMSRQWRLLQHLDVGRLKAAERKICGTWDCVSVANDSDIDALKSFGSRRAIHVPNIVDRPCLSDSVSEKRFRVLFVGNLNFRANHDGLMLFLEHAWPRLLRAHPGSVLRVVGLSPPPSLRSACDAPGVELHANVPDVEPYYADCDVVISPVLFGSGTRIKILEAMAYGRAVVSTTIGAEGLGAQPGKDLLIGDTMPEFADALIALARNPGSGHQLAQNARRLQQSRFGPDAMAAAIESMIT